MAGKTRISQGAVAAIILFITLVTRMGGNVFLPSLPKIASEFGIDKVQATFNINLYSIALALSFAFLGPLTDIVKKRTLLMYGSIACLISHLLCGLAVNIYMIDIGRLILAVGSGLIIITAQTWIGDRSGKDELLGRLAWFSLLVALAPMLAPVLGGIVTDYFSWRWNFWLMTILTLLVIFVIFLIKSRKEQQQPDKVNLNPIILLKTYREIIRNTALFRISVVILTLFMLQGAFLAFSSFLFIDDMGITASQYGLLSVVFAGSMLVGRFPTMFLEKRYTIRRVMLFNIGVVVISIAGSLVYYQIMGSHTVLEIIIFMTLMRLGFSGLAILGMRNCMFLDPERKGTISGLYSFLNHTSGWLGVILTQALYQSNLNSRSIYNITLVISLVLIAIGIYLFLGAYPRIRELLENREVQSS
ncbi:MAG: MFS transporter [Bacteroidota bacterium]